MSARRLARELAVIVFPQLPKDKSKLEKLELAQIVTRAVQMLADHAKQCLSEADSMMVQAGQHVIDWEIEHPDNAENVESISAVPVTTAQLRTQLTLIERSIHLVSEALDIPEIILQSGGTTVDVECKKCKHLNKKHLQRPGSSEVLEFLYTLINTYVEHKDEIDELIRQSRAKWRIERMVSIDRDILRLACAEAFFLPEIPIPVAINEAVELSHRFADSKAVKFINGILAEMAEDAAHFRRTGTHLDRGTGEHGSLETSSRGTK